MHKNQNIIFHIALVGITLIGALILVLSTHQGMGVGGDATIYLTTARNLMDGNGMGLVGPKGEFRLIPYAPPFSPILLSFFGLLKLDILNADKWLNILFFGLFILWMGESIFWLTRSKWVAGITALLFTISPVMFPVYSWAMTEPLLMFLGFGSLILLVVYLLNQNQRWLLYASAVGVGLAFVTHYKAVPFLITGSLSILFLTPGKFSDRLKETFLYGLLGSTSMAAWLLFSVSFTSGFASRSLEAVPEMAEKLNTLLMSLGEVFLFWFIPDSWITAPAYPSVLNLLFIGVVILLFAAWCAWVVWNMGRKPLQEETKRLRLAIAMLGFFVLTYLLMIFAVYLTIFPPITINLRMLSPVFAAVLWLAGILTGYSLNQTALKGWMRVGVICLAVVLVGWYGMRSTRIVQTNYQQGMGYQTISWRDSETLQAVKNLPPETLIVTNEELLILYWLNIPSYPLAEIYWNEPVSAYYRYGDGDLSNDSAQQVFREEGAYLVLFDTINDQFTGKYGDQTPERLRFLTDGLEVVFTGSDGAIYIYP